jgi:hypothetical protein
LLKKGSFLVSNSIGRSSLGGKSFDKEQNMSGFMNEASWDRILRVGVGIALIAVGFSGAVEGGLGTFLGVFGFVPLITGLLGWCPLYAIFRFRTNRESAKV